MADAPTTLVEAVEGSLAQSLRSPDGVAPPVAVLWADPEGQWLPLIPTLQKAIPQLFVLGDYASDERRGPVIWLRCIVDRTLPEVSPPDGIVPILYLPRVSRQDLRAAGDCPPELQPLIELQYRGTTWHQRNGRDWSVDAFLMSEDGLALDIARDSRTRDAMLRSLPLLATEPAVSLRGRRLEADDFDRLAIGDPVRDLLTWLSDVDAFQEQSDGRRWAAFRDISIRQFGFDPGADGPQVAADALIAGGGAWDDVWKRFCEAPKLYPGVSQALRQARPKDLFAATGERRPAVNEEREESLRRALGSVLSLAHAQGCDKIVALDAEHKERRGWVWAQLGESPYAIALEPLGRLASTAKQTLGGATIQAMAEAYAGDGWRCDRAAMDALAIIKAGPENALITKIVRAIYEPWLDRSARRFQELLSEPGVDPSKLVEPVRPERDSCVLFADGLRFDVGTALHERLETQGFRVRIGHRYSAIPTVTATAKPIASPAHGACTGKGDADDFSPAIAVSGQVANASRLRDAMARAGVEVLGPDEVSMATGAEGGGWTEAGKLDSLGHSLGALLVRQIDAEVDVLIDRIAALLGSGWTRVRVVTDHGWLLLPGGLPKVELPQSLVATKWARCAAVKGGSSPAVPTYPWYWDPVLRIASPPGVGSFMAGTEYAHGGISLQECVIPDLVVERGEEAASATITEISWRGMRCRISVEGKAPGLIVDLRLNWKQPASSIAASPKPVTSGEASLAVSDDKHEGAAASVVVTDGTGRVLDYKPTSVGENI